MLNTMKLPENIREYFQRQGRIGAAKRLEVVTPEQRSEIARTAAVARWANKPKKKAATTSRAKKGTK
jgi:hypothetical protein